MTLKPWGKTPQRKPKSVMGEKYLAAQRQLNVIATAAAEAIAKMPTPKRKKAK